MGKIIAIANQKGGVGKTTTCVNLGAAVHSKGKHVLICDLDPQGNCTSGFGVSKESEPNIYGMLLGSSKAADCIVKTKNGDVIPANKELSGATVELVDMESREYRLKNALEPLRQQYDYIFIDCPPSLEMLTLNSLVAADSVIIPVQCEYYAMEGLTDLLTTIEMTKRRLNPELSIEGIVLTMYDSRIKLTGQVADEIRRYFPDQLYTNTIPRNVRLTEAPSHGKPVIEYDRFSKGSRAYSRLASEFLRRSKKAE